MIPKIYKLKLRKEVDFFHNCERYYSRYFQIFYRHSNNNQNTKAVVVVPKKTVKLRVNRTKIKRQIYGLSLPLLRKSRGLDMVFVINKKIITAKKQELINDLTDVFFKLNYSKK